MGLLLPLLSACAAPVATTDRSDDSDKIVERSFDVAYRQIADRYLDPVPVEQLALEGMRSVTTLDPLITVEQSDDKVRLKRAGVPLAGYNRPAADDSPAWARLTSRLFADARAHSDMISGTDQEQIYRAVFDGSLSLLDSFSRYAGANQALENRAKRSGFYGIGVKFRRHDQGAFVTEVFPGSPAKEAGLQADDIITGVDGTSLGGLNQIMMRRLVRGTKSTAVRIVVQRKGQTRPINLKVVRKRVIAPTVRHQIRNGVAVFTVSGFNRLTAKSLENQLRKARRKLGTQARGIVIDMRSNPGGLLTQAVKVADLFLRTGRIVATHGRHPDSRHDYRAREGDMGKGLPLVVLINGRSASASEIVAAALQDHERAVVVGTGSFGKGTVQSVTRLPNEGEMTLTWSRFISPAGYVLHGLGVPPSVCTSDGRGTARQHVDRIFENDEKLRSMVETWRRVRAEDDDLRQTLRLRCPADSRKRKIDLEIAELLLADRQLYDRILAATSQPSVSAR